jgi:hypothetical protein
LQPWPCFRSLNSINQIVGNPKQVNGKTLIARLKLRKLPVEEAIVAEEAGMDTEHHVIAKLLVLKDAPDDALLDQVEAIGVTAARHMLFDKAARLQHTDLPAATDCAALADRIDALIRPA